MSHPLAATALRHDPRIEEAKKLLLAAVADHQAKITGVRGPSSELKSGYERLLADFGTLRGGNLWYPYIGSGIGRGALVELADGSVKYDFISGIGVHYFGHSDPRVIGASIDAAIGNTVMQGHLQQNGEAMALGKILTEQSGMDHAFFTTCGARALENALKLAFQKHAPASRVLCFDHCFSGRTLATSQMTDKPNFREGLPQTLSVDYVPFYDGTDQSIDRAENTLLEHLKRHPGKYAAMVTELVQGEGGFHVGSKVFFERLIARLKEHNVAVIVDEVQTFARTPELFAFRHFGLDQLVDLVVIGKVAHACATLYRSAYKPRPGLMSQTYTASSSAFHASLLYVRTALSEGYFGATGRISSLHDHFARNLANLAKRHPTLAAGPFGIGSMIAFTPLGGDTKKVTAFSHKLFEAGVLGFIAGSNPTRMRFLLPVGAVTHDDIDQVMSIIEQTLIECSKAGG